MNMNNHSDSWWCHVQAVILKVTVKIEVIRYT